MVKLKTIKIAFIHPDLGIGGAERLVLDVAVALANQGQEVTFVTNHFDKRHAFEELKSGKFPVRIIGNGIPRSVCGICQALCAYLRMLYLALVYVFFTSPEEKPDIYFVDQIPMAVPIIKWSGGKVIYYCHHPDLLASASGGLLKKIYRWPINWLELKGTNQADMILVNSKYTAFVFGETFPEITKNIQILYPTIASSYQKTIENIKGLKPVHELVPEIPRSQTENVVYLSINRFHPAKQLKLAINAFEILKDRLSKDDWDRVYLIIAGGYDPHSAVNRAYFNKLVKIVKHKELASKVIFLRSPSDDLKAQLLLSCDCLVYTPVNEHFGIVPLEAMTAGKPVIACNTGGPRETVQHDTTGYLCEPTPGDMAGYMSKILDKQNARAMGAKGKQRLEEHFSYNKFETRVMDAVVTLIASHETNN